MSEIKPTGKSWVARAKPTDAHGDWLIVAGEDENRRRGQPQRRRHRPGLRYWVHAKDSGAAASRWPIRRSRKARIPKLLP